jgi:hypothetical protein
VDKNIKEDKELPFNEPLVLYNKVLGGLENKMVILEVGEDNNSWLNNMEVLYSTILGNPHQNISEKEPVMAYLVPNNY